MKNFDEAIKDYEAVLKIEQTEQTEAFLNAAKIALETKRLLQNLRN